MLVSKAHVRCSFRLFLAAIVSFMLFAAAIPRFLSAPLRDMPEDSGAKAAQYRLQAAALAFASGRMNPQILIITDWRSVYLFPAQTTSGQDNEEASVPVEFRLLSGSIHYAAPAPLLNTFSPGESGYAAARLPKNRVLPRCTYDMVFLDCAFPGGLFVRDTALWSEKFFRDAARAIKPGGIFALVLPENQTAVSAELMSTIRTIFGNAGTFRFGERMILTAGSEIIPLYDLDGIDRIAASSGYYSFPGGVPSNAFELILGMDYSPAPPADMLEASFHAPLSDSRSDVLFQTKMLPAMQAAMPFGIGVHLTDIIFWSLILLAAVYLPARYFISWKPVHKQVFLTFENFFFLTGILLACTLINLRDPNRSSQIAGPLVLLIAGVYFLESLMHRASASERIPIAARIMAAVLIFVEFALPFWKNNVSGITLFACLAAVTALPLVRDRFREPVEPHAAVSLASIGGAAAAFLIFGLCLCLSGGLFAFTVLLCVMRLIFR